MQTSDWTDRITAYAGDDTDLATFALKWVDMESGGNPCSTGRVTSFVMEAGIGQNYFETPSSVSFGVSLPQLRIACSGSTQKQARDLTDAEMDAQVHALMAMIAHFVDVARGQLAALGLTWSTHDFYCLVKLQHGLPGIPKSYLGSLGDPPADWATFRSNVENADAATLASIDSGTARYQPFGGIFNNAEKCASVLATVDDIVNDPLAVAQGLIGDELIVPAGVLVGAAVLGKVNG